MNIPIMSWEETCETSFLELDLLNNALSPVSLSGLAVILQVIVGLSVWSVWTWRLDMATTWRGNAAGSLNAEFAEYGIPKVVFQLTGVFKLAAATAVLVGIPFPQMPMPLVDKYVHVTVGSLEELGFRVILKSLNPLHFLIEHQFGK